MARDERARRRPSAHVPGDVVERHGLLDHEVGCGKFGERKFDGLVTLLRDPPFRRPIGTHDVAVEAAHDPVDLRCDLEHHIRPHRDHAAWPEDTPNLGPKSGAVEPVQRLRHRDEIDRSVDLVTVAQALHWFDRARFWTEVRRVLRPSGVIAVWTYVMLEIAPQIDKIVRRFYSNVVGPYWPPERRITEERYQTIEFPFAEFTAPDFVIEQPLTLDDVAGYVRTWSATRAFITRHGEDPVARLVSELGPLWGDPRQSRLARWPVAMRVGRIE